ncbi:flagellar filament capping protein FliD [Oceanobacillus sp. J11TS1]|uniref:flagellar filament capping protein FliD n=1 Tax=Oceanobacillus sp. J11TS1 TaxID=2807191 RepID=UPI001B089E92|nr:flagellar filament capping protein FliD [Oceanobacillus sp. J11TS1]GIO23877.1 flagellar hook-associated protein 2 [Oceanobacillus sp. J11TS1]
MRIGGLASGIDTESIIKDLMNAERLPLNKLQQDRTKLEWKRDAFRDVNKLLLDLDQKKILNMKLSDTYNKKIVTSTQEGAVRATGSAGASNGTYRIEVKQLATSAINVGEKLNTKDDLKFNPDETLASQGFTGPIKFRTYGKDDSYGGDGKNFREHRYEIEEGDKLSDVIKRINDDKDSPVRMTYDENSDRVILEATRTGVYNPGGQEIEFEDKDGGNFFKRLGLHQKPEEIKDEDGVRLGEHGARNAEFTYNNAYTVNTQDNHYQLNGVTFQFLDETKGTATLNITNDIDNTVDKIKEFVEAYNEIVEAISGSQREEVHRDFPPLTEEQKADMSDREIELWEEKAKSGMLKGETALTSGLANMRSSWYSTVKNDGQFASLTEIGISTSPDYMDGGKLIIDEDKLREVVANDPESVQKLFSNNTKDDGRGLINRLEDAVEGTIAQVNQRAGRATDVSLDSYALGKRMKEINERITNFERRLGQVESRYWKQFSEMERAISMMNEQSNMLMSNFNPGAM